MERVLAARASLREQRDNQVVVVDEEGRLVGVRVGMKVRVRVRVGVGVRVRIRDTVIASRRDAPREG